MFIYLKDIMLKEFLNLTLFILEFYLCKTVYAVVQKIYYIISLLLRL